MEGPIPPQAHAHAGGAGAGAAPRRTSTAGGSGEWRVDARGEDPGLIINNYLADHNVRQVLANLFQQLMEQKLLPFNPFPMFVQRIRLQSQHTVLNAFTEKHLTAVLKLNEIRGRTDGLPFASAVNDMGQEIFGLAQVLRLADIAKVHNYQDIIDFHTRLPHFDEYSEYRCETCVAMLLPSLLGRLYPESASLHLQQDIVLHGPDIDRAMEYFAVQIASRIKTLGASKDSLAVDVTISGISTAESWSFKQIRKDREGFLSALAVAAASGKHILANCIFAHRGTNVYVQTSYCASYKEVATSRFRLLNGCPFSAFYTGAFLDEEHAKRFAALCIGSETDPQSIPAPDDPAVYRVFHEQQCQIAAGLHLTFDTVEIAEIYLKILLVECGESAFVLGEDGFHKILCVLQILNSNCARVSALAERCFRLLHFSNIIAESSPGTALPFVQDYFGRFREDIERLFRESQSNVLANLRGWVQNELRAVPAHLEGSSLAMHEALEKIRRGLKAAFIEFSANSLPWCTQVAAFYESCKAQHSLGAQQGEEEEEEAEKRQRFARLFRFFRSGDAQEGGEALNAEAVLKGAEHGLELPDNDNLFVDVDDVIATSPAPRALRLQFAKLQYITDTRVDETIEEALLDILTSAQLPPNPYPFLEAHLRSGMWRIQLCGDPDDRLLARLLKHNAVEVLQSPTVHQLLGSPLFGLGLSLAGVSPQGIVPLIQLVQRVANPSLPYRKNYQSAIIFALTGNATLYGQLIPHITEVDTREDYTVVGEFRDEAIELFTSGVAAHLQELYNLKDEGVIISGVHIAGAKWGISEVAHNAQEMRVEMHSAIQKHEPCYVLFHLFEGWRYIPVRKTLVFHFQTPDGRNVHTSATSLSAFESIYSNPVAAQAALSHMRLAGSPDEMARTLANTQRLVRAQLVQKAKHGDMLLVYRLLLLRARLKEDYTHLVDVWRMFHSPAEQFAYLRTLASTLTRLLSDLMDHDWEPRQRQRVITNASRMFVVFQNKLKKVLQSRLILCNAAFVEALLGPLDALWVKDKETKEISLSLSEASIDILNSLTDDLEMIGVDLAMDIHRICPAVQDTLRIEMSQYGLDLALHERDAKNPKAPQPRRSVAGGPTDNSHASLPARIVDGSDQSDGDAGDAANENNYMPGGAKGARGTFVAGPHGGLRLPVEKSNRDRNSMAPGDASGNATPMPRASIAGAIPRRGRGRATGDRGGVAAREPRQGTSGDGPSSAWAAKGLDDDLYVEEDVDEMASAGQAHAGVRGAARRGIRGGGRGRGRPGGRGSVATGLGHGIGADRALQDRDLDLDLGEDGDGADERVAVSKNAAARVRAEYHATRRKHGFSFDPY